MYMHFYLFFVFIVINEYNNYDSSSERSYPAINKNLLPVNRECLKGSTFWYIYIYIYPNKI